MKNLLLLLILVGASQAFAQVVVWDNFDACSGNWHQSAVVGTKNSFRPPKFLNTPPQSQQGGCYLAYATADTFHANSAIGWFAQQKFQVWKHRWVNIMMFSRDAGVKVTMDLADDFDGDSLTLNDVDTMRSVTKVLNGGWQEINFDLKNDFTDINPTIGNNKLDSTIRSLTFRFSTGSSYSANDTVYIQVDEIQNSDTTGFAFLSVFPLTLKPDVLTGLTQNYAVYLQNNGSAPTPLRNVSLTGPGMAHYTLTRVPTMVDIAGRDSIIVHYAPTVPGPDLATLSFQTNAVDNPQVTVAINGLADTAIARPVAFMIFPLASTAVGTSITDIAVIRNIGRVPLQIMPYDSINGPGAGDYAVLTNFHGIIAPGATDSITVRFTPRFSGNRPASLKLYFRKTTTTLDSVFVPMLGVGGSASINTTPIQYNDSVTVGDSAYYTVSMTNYGTYGVRMTSQTLQGFDSPMFTIVRKLYAPLDPGFPDSVIVKFKPTSLGIKFAYLQLVTDAQNQPIVIVPFTIVVGTRILAPSPTSVFVTDTALVGSTISRSVLCQSTGTLSIRIDSVRLLRRDKSASFSITHLPRTLLQAGENDTLSINFAPTTQGIKIDTIRFYTNSPSVPTADVALRGFAGARRIFISDTILIDTVTIERTYTHCITVRDSGNLPIMISNIVIGGANADQFTLVKPALLPHTIPAGGIDTICVRIHPTSQGNKVAQMLVQTDAQNQSNMYVTMHTYGTTVGVQDPWQQPFSGLITASPNPFRDATALTISLAVGEHVTHLGVFDLLGRELRDLTPRANGGNISLEMERYPAGLYYARLSTTMRTSTLPLVVAR